MSEQPFDMPPASAGFEARGGWLVRRLAADFQLQLHQSAGPVGNMGFESNGFRSLQEIHPVAGRGGFGWEQWTGPRRRNFEAWAATNGLDPASDPAEYGFFVYEHRGAAAGVMDRLRQANTLERAVFIFGVQDEAPGGTTSSYLPGYNGRLDYGRRALANAVGTPIVIPAPVPQAASVIDNNIRSMQTALKLAGYYKGNVDGDPGSLTYAALRDYHNARTT